ncbi:MAG TPA: arylsulfotransferase family protein [Solirubrobacteraceae bacterium]|nr:arylsulfotransferase family protein [Solirubrobacteraceae bacterium]
MAAPCALAPVAGATAIDAYTTKGALSYVSAPNLHPPKLTTLQTAGASKLAPGYIMVANFKNLASSQEQIGQGGPLMLDRDLRPVWIHPTPTNVYSLNFRTQTFGGKPALSWWQGVVTSSGVVESGEDVVVNQQYKTVATLKGSGGWLLTPHEFLIHGNDAWVTATEPVSGVNLTAFGGPASGTIIDSAVQEYDLKTGKLLYTWSAYQNNHIPLAQSQTQAAAKLATSAATGWDAYHVNAINLVGNNEFLVSMRNTWGAYLVNIATGSIVWTLGAGSHSSFTFASGATFQWQHDVELHAGNIVSVFDDACCAVIGPGEFAPPVGPSRGLVLKLDTTAHTATLVRQYTHSPTLETATQGDTQLLSDGDAMIGWGGQPYLTEYSRTGRVLLDASFPGPDISYRAYVQSWVGKPNYSPSAAGRTQGRKTTIYASWNGATSVASWAVLGGADSRHLKRVAAKAKAGFETAIPLNKGYRQYRVTALDAKGHVIGRSKLFHAVKGAAPPPATGY